MGIHRGIERKSRGQSGFTMVEVMVALVVLAVGLLGIAALLLKSLQSGRTATYRTQAVNLAADLADRIRANRTAQADYGTLFADTPAVVGACDTTGGCSASRFPCRNRRRRTEPHTDRASGHPPAVRRQG